MNSAAASIHVTGLSKSKLHALRVQAKSAGVSTEKYAKQLIESGISVEQQARTRSFDELTAGIRADFSASGMTEEELDQLVNEARKRHHERLAKKKR